MASKKTTSDKDSMSIARNKRARYDYEILETLEAGLVLTGIEVKSLRQGQGTLTGAFVRQRDDELWLEGLEVPRYEHASTHKPHDPARARKLLLKRGQIDRLAKQIATKGLAVVALHLYFTRGLVKVEIGLARGKKNHDKRAGIKKREVDRQIARLHKNR